MRSRHFSIRSFTAVFLTLIVLCGFGYNLYDIQIVNEEYYKAQNNAVKTYTVPIEAARGEIVDRNGNSLVTNRQGKSVVFKYSDVAFSLAKGCFKNHHIKTHCVKHLRSLREQHRAVAAVKYAPAVCF